MSQAKAQRERIGDMLVASGLVTAAQLQEALRAQQASGTRLGKVLVSLGYVTELQLAQALSNQLSIPWLSLERIEFSRDLLARVPAALADRHTLMPVYVRSVRGQGDTLYVAMEDPTDELALQSLTSAARLPVKAMIASPSDIRRAIDRHYFAEPSAPAAAAPPASAPSAPSPEQGAGLHEALQRAAETLQNASEVVRVDAPRVQRVPPVPSAAKQTSQRTSQNVPVEEYETPSQPPAENKRTLTFLDGTRISVPPAGAKRLSPDVVEVRQVIRAIRATIADAGVEEPLTWHEVVQALLDAAAARGLRLTRKDVAEAWLALHDKPRRSER